MTNPEGGRPSRPSGGHTAPRRSGPESALRTGGIPGAIVRLRFFLIAAWIVAVALAVPGARQVSDRLQVQGGGLEQAESHRADRELRSAFERPIAAFFAVTIQGEKPLTDSVFSAFLDSLAAVAKAEPYIDRVVTIHSTPDSALISQDKRTTFIIAGVTVGLVDPTLRVPAFRKAIHDAHRRLHPRDGFEVNVTGGPALDYDVRTVSKSDAEVSEARALPLSAVILVLAFGALVAAAVPIVVGIFGIVCAYALVHLVSGLYPMSVFVVNIVSMVGLGVGIDYSLLIVTRFREEMNRGLSAREAAARTIATAGLAVVTSGLTVVVGFAALFVVPLNETRSVAIGGLLVVGSAVLLAVTFLPALLATLGRSLDLPKWLAKRLAWYHAPSAWERWARWLSHHPSRAIAIGGLLVASITWPLVNIKLGLPRAGWFPSATESGAGVRALESMGARGALQPIRVLVRVPEGSRVVSSKYLRALRRLSDSIHVDPRVYRLRSVVDMRPGTSILQYSIMYSDMAATRAKTPDFFAAYLSPDSRTTIMDVILEDSTSFTSAMDVVRHARLAAANIPALDSASVLVGGFAAASVDLQDEVLSRLPLLVALVLIATAVMLFVAFRSILVPIKAVVMNCLSVGGAFGLIVLVFQHGVGARFFGIDGPTEAVYVLVPVLVFAIVFGLSMDYEVFLLSRVKEAFDRTGRNDQATMEGLSATASTITSAAGIMIVVFGAASFSRGLMVQLMGFGLAVAVFLDATLIRMVLVPAIMHLAGRWNWWPGVSAPTEEEPT